MRRLFIVPQNKDLKRLVRARMAETGENYTQALTHVLGQEELDPLPSAWHRTGSHARDYEVGLLPETVTYNGNRVAQLRLRSGISEPTGFGALIQSIAATRYLGRRVRFSATVRTHEVSGWAGLWLRVDGPGSTLVLDNMEDRPVRGNTDWTPAEIVLDVAENATKLHFGALLDGAGAMDIARPRFEEASDSAPTKTWQQQLPEEPQALDFTVAPMAAAKAEVPDQTRV